MGSWNIGGTSLQNLPTAIAQVMYQPSGSVSESDTWHKHMVVGLQELPRDTPGWKTDELEGWTLVQYRADDEWRGQGILFARDEWTVLRRKGLPKGFG